VYNMVINICLLVLHLNILLVKLLINIMMSYFLTIGAITQIGSCHIWLL